MQLQQPTFLPPHNNQFLFSDHYLNSLLPQDPRWQNGLRDAQTFAAFLRDLYAREKEQLPHYNEAQLEQNWLRKILVQLGHVFEIQASIPGLEAHISRPDYVFFANDAERQAATRAQGTHEYGRHALAVGEVKAWDVPLGKKLRGGGPSFDAQNPSWQIAQYVSALGLNWGILSNGRAWRLVQRDSCGRLAIYYQVDLVELLAQNDVGTFRYFTLFFARNAFRPDAQGHVFVDDVLHASAAYARGLEQDLRENVYRALERLMQGFLDLPANKLTQARLREIYDNSLYLLYRLLFILYGESRGLLPLQNDHYRANYSLTTIKQEIAALKYKPAYKTTVYWGRLKNLFQIINGDDAALNRELGVPRYNGGLFNPNMHPFLEQHAVGDGALVEAIDLLSRRDAEFVDYRTLGVRQLGSIYEGLLEYQPRFAAQAMVAVRENKGERWMPQSDAPANAKTTATRDVGAVYLETDRGERKATGSYYTPEYIVQYIVQNTLGPLVQAARTRVQARGDGRQRALSLADAVLNLRVLDPAMGSGHFLVDAMEFLALELANDPYLQEEIPGDEDLVYWKRRVVERCIYGVDKNPLAVELAKLSLWLATVAADQPLSFLDHHLKHGDSLIGALVDDLGSAPPVLLTKKQLAHQQAGQLNLFQHRLQERLPQVMRAILEITEAESDTYERVQLKEVANEALVKLKAPFEQVASLWTSAYFGNKFSQGDYGEALDSMTTQDRLAALPAIQRAQDIADARDFFHWELAFPEVFYDRNGQSLGERAGFDGVIGNPPYITTGTLRSVDMDVWQYYKTEFVSASSGKFDIYLPFVERAFTLINAAGRAAYILPNKWMQSDAASALRMLLAKERAVESITDFGAQQVFEGITTYTCVSILTRHPKTEIKFAEAHIPIPHELSWSEIKYQELGDKPWNLRSDFWQRFKNEQFVPLDQATVIYVGTSTNADDVFILEQTEKKGTFFRAYSRADDEFLEIESNACIPFVRGKDLGRYEFANQSVVVLFPYKDGNTLIDAQTMAKRFPMAWAYLQRHRRVLEDRENGLWRGKDDWYGHAYPRNHSQIRLSKILSPDICTHGEWVADFEGKYHCLNTVYGVSTPKSDIALGFLLAILNSNVFEKYMRMHSVDLRGGYYRVTKNFMSAFPIRRISFTTSASERAQLVAQITHAYEVGARENETRAVLQLAAQCLQHSPEQSDVVHDVLAHLARQMIDLNKQKQNVTRAFWDDLEGVTDAAVFKPLQKAKQEASLLKTSDALQPFLRADSHAARTLDESLAWNADAFKAFVKALTPKIKNLSDLVRVYHKHHARYADLAARLQFTDALIDEIVYQLYGLTPSEIKVVQSQSRAE